jgi:hypothetical protein
MKEIWPAVLTFSSQNFTRRANELKEAVSQFDAENEDTVAAAHAAIKSMFMLFDRSKQVAFRTYLHIQSLVSGGDQPTAICDKADKNRVAATGRGGDRLDSRILYAQAQTHHVLVAAGLKKGICSTHGDRVRRFFETKDSAEKELKRNGKNCTH